MNNARLSDANWGEPFGSPFLFEILRGSHNQLSCDRASVEKISVEGK